MGWLKALLKGFRKASEAIDKAGEIRDLAEREGPHIAKGVQKIRQHAKPTIVKRGSTGE